VRHASDYHAKGPPDWVAFVNEVDMVISDGSNAVCFIRSFGLYVYAVYLEHDYDMYDYGLQGTSNRSIVVSPKPARFRKSNQSQSLTRQVGVA
jgi:hypothetical protein